MNAPLNRVRVCYFGHYDPCYSRNRILKKALELAGATILEVRSQSQGLERYIKLLQAIIPHRFDVLVVGFPGHTDVPLARLVGLVKRCPVVFDAMISLYDSNAWDRKLVHPRSMAARRYYWTDSIACRLADLVLLDTNAHIGYFSETFGLPRGKFCRVWVGSDDEVMYPRSSRPPDGPPCQVLFYGSYIPLHGVEHILHAAKILEGTGDQIQFRILGTGQTFSEVHALARDLRVNNVQFLPSVPYEQLPGYIASAAICLGIFGTSEKAQRVVPNKVFDALAMGRPVLTGDTPAIREALTPYKDLWVSPVGDPAGLATAILHLKHSPELRQRIGNQGFAKYQQTFSISKISRDVAEILLKLNV